MSEQARQAYRDAIAGDFRATAACDDPSWRPLFDLMRFAAGIGAAPAIEAAGEAAPYFATERARVFGACLDPRAPSPWGEAVRGALEMDRALALEQEAARAGAADRVIEAASLAALAALHAGDLARATSIARRASRMARTEAMPQLEYLAHLVLARVRRSTGRPHLATLILGSLAKVAPPLWRGWLALELALAGAPSAELAASAVDGPAARAAIALSRWDLASARAALGGPFAAEIDAIAIAIDPRAPTDDPFLRGETHALPPALAGVALLFSPCAIAGRRVLMQSDPPQQARTETAIATLLLAGALEREELFARVYGFSFDAALHAGVLDVLLHRVRAYLGERGELVREGDRFSIRADGPFAVPDPRCERSLDDRLLRALAEGAHSAKDAAAKLGVPLRTVQALLSQLVDEGACTAEKKGRTVSYRVEDTTFSEPTR